MPHPLMRWFVTGQLPAHLAAVSRPFGELAEHMDATLPEGPQKDVMMQKLLEAKDAGVRQAIP